MQWRREVSGQAMIVSSSNQLELDLAEYDRSDYGSVFFICSTSNVHGSSPESRQSLLDLHVQSCPSSSSVGIVIAIIAVLVLVAIVAVAVFWKRKMFCFSDGEYEEGRIEEDEDGDKNVEPDYDPVEREAVRDEHV